MVSHAQRNIHYGIEGILGLNQKPKEVNPNLILMIISKLVYENRLEESIF